MPAPGPRACAGHRRRFPSEKEIVVSEAAQAVQRTAKLSGPVSQFIAQKRKMLIDGKWVDAASGKTLDVYDPATGDVVAHVAEGDKEDIDRAVKSARKA